LKIENGRLYVNDPDEKFPETGVPNTGLVNAGEDKVSPVNVVYVPPNKTLVDPNVIGVEKLESNSLNGIGAVLVANV
jgi:hypothetical protein